MLFVLNIIHRLYECNHFRLKVTKLLHNSSSIQ